uniref:Collagen IV NC1 domain-containing protein n=1 Tax=Oryzias latipes TaxID=8090 RepID=A0A3P9HSM9_ORYLA
RPGPAGPPRGPQSQRARSGGKGGAAPAQPGGQPPAPPTQGPTGEGREKGDPGQMITDGKTPGEPGKPGFPGYTGLKGEPGTPGPSGLSGSPGFPGVQGSQGQRGETGSLGDAGLRGEEGLVGDQGPKGLKGQKGSFRVVDFKGEVMFSHTNCLKVFQTLPCSGLDAGEKGDRGPPGLLGRTGYSGQTGFSGNPGASGITGPEVRPGAPCREKTMGFLLVVHSQSESIPRCPLQTEKLWEGYSLLYLEGQEKAYTQDLGAAGSCVRVFSTMPFSSCDMNRCLYASRNDKSYWLSTMANVTREPVMGDSIRSLISRCVVCEAPSTPVAMHSQNSIEPKCPSNWATLWTGYSFIMHTGAGDEGGGQSLTSSGSCLTEFKSLPFLECQGPRGTCHFFANIYSFWLTHQEGGASYTRRNSSTLIDPMQHKNNISRCRVCMKLTNQ